MYIGQHLHARLGHNWYQSSPRVRQHDHSTKIVNMITQSRWSADWKILPKNSIYNALKWYCTWAILAIIYMLTKDLHVFLSDDMAYTWFPQTLKSAWIWLLSWKVLDFSICLENWQHSLKSAWKSQFMGLKNNDTRNLMCLCVFYAFCPFDFNKLNSDSVISSSNLQSLLNWSGGRCFPHGEYCPR